MGWEWHIIEEEKAIRAFRKVIESAGNRLKDPAVDEVEAIRVMQLARHWVERVFPDKLQAYDAIYKPRFEHIYYGGKGRDKSGKT